MKPSSKRNPCPICGRTANDRCRFNDEAVLCHWGSDLHPPEGMHVGDTVEINGVVWALTRTDCGHAGSSSMFVIHQERGIAPTNQQARLRKVAMEMAAVDVFERDAELADQAHRLIVSLPVFNSLPPDRLRQAIALCRDGDVLLKSLVGRAHRLRRYSPDIAPVAERMKDALKEISYQQKDLLNLWHNTLLDPGAGRGEQLAQQLQPHANQGNV